MRDITECKAPAFVSSDESNNRLAFLNHSLENASPFAFAILIGATSRRDDNPLDARPLSSIAQ